MPGVEHVEFEWDAPPPLRPEDERYYLGVILPAIHRLLAARAEQPVGRALYVRTPPSP
jgi:hypothetical protein